MADMVTSIVLDRLEPSLGGPPGQPRDIPVHFGRNGRS